MKEKLKELIEKGCEVEDGKREKDALLPNTAEGGTVSSNLPLQVKEQWWGAELPSPRDDSVPQLSLWRPWEGKMEKGGLKKKWGGFKKRSPAAEARSLGRLLRWQEKLEPQLGPSRLQQ